jgi:hypothetical protein
MRPALVSGVAAHTRPATAAAKFRASDREAQILELRLRKIPFEKIGQIVGMTKSAVCKAYGRALRRVSVRLAKEIVTEELETLDRMDSPHLA